MKEVLMAVAIIIFITSCNNKPPTPPITKTAEDTAAINIKRLTALELDYKNDPVCRMSTKFGIEDTMLYKGKIIGFCSEGCKDAFIKSPAQYTLK